MMRNLPLALLAAAEGGGHGEETLAGVMMHHITNSELNHPVLDAWGISKAVLMMMIASGFLIVLLGWSLRKSRISRGAPSGVTNAIESLAVFVRDEIAIPNMGSRYGLLFTPFLLTLFFFILTCNLLGLVPGAYTATSNLNVTAALALLTLGMIIVSGMVVQGPVGYLKHMVPPGTPLLVAPMVFVIELLGLFVKPIALTIRLGANMTAGHIVIFVMIGFIFIFESFLVVPLAVPLAVAMNLLELIVAFIQAYVFTLLTGIFIGMVTHSSH